METISRKIVDSMVNRGDITDSNRDIYEYGATMTISFVINFAITIAVGLIFGKPLELILLFLSFISLRTTSGGVHAKSFWSCVLISTIAIATALAAVLYTPQTAAVPLSIALIGGTCFVVFRFAPVEHPNQPLEPEEIAKYRNNARVVMCVCVLAVIFFALIQAERVMLSVAFGSALSGVSMLAMHILRRKEGIYSEKT